MHQQLFLTPLSVFSLGRFWAWRGGLGGSVWAFLGPRAVTRENHETLVKHVFFELPGARKT